MNNIKPFGNNILVKPQEHNTILKATEGSLCDYGEVIEIGSDVQTIKVGDIIGFTVFGINALEIDGKKHYFVPEMSEFILGTIQMSGSLAS